MLFNTFADSALLCNVSVTGATSQDGVVAFRGDMVIIEGEIADDQGRRLPPKATIKQAVALAKEDTLSFLSGAIDDVQNLPLMVEKYRANLSSDTLVLLYASNLGSPVITDIDGIKCTVLPHDEGAVWTMLMDDLRLEKSDFKGQSAEDKVITMFESAADFNPKCDTVTFDQVLERIVEVKREARGPV